MTSNIESRPSKQEEIQVTTETPGMVFPMELRREQMLVDFLPDSCDDCKPKRQQKAIEFAMWSGRISVSRAAELVEERFPCVHLED
jgi:hypothetical protein